MKKIMIALLIIAVVAVIYCSCNTDFSIVGEFFSRDGIGLWGPLAATLIDGFVLGVLTEDRRLNIWLRAAEERERHLTIERDLWKERAGRC